MCSCVSLLSLHPPFPPYFPPSLPSLLPMLSALPSPPPSLPSPLPPLPSPFLSRPTPPPPLPPVGSHEDPLAEMHLLPEPLFTLPSDNIGMVSVMGTPAGRIFLAGQDGCLHEVVYQADDGWFHRKCRRVNHSTSVLSYFVPSFLSFSEEGEWGRACGGTCTPVVHQGVSNGHIGGIVCMRACVCVCVCVPMGGCVLMGGWVCLGVVSTRPSLLRVLLRPCVLTTTACCSQLLCLRYMFVHSVLFRTTDSQPYQELYASAEKKNPLTITTQSNDHY